MSIATRYPISEKEQQILSQMASKVATVSPSLDLPHWAEASGESVGDLMVRFLKARKWDLEKSFQMLTEDVKWRREMNLDELVQMEPSKVIGVDNETIHRYFPCWSQGVDKEGRPVLYKSYGGNFEIWKLTERGATVESLLRYHIYENEKNLRLLAQQPPDRRASTFTIVVEAKGWRVGLATRDAMRYIRGMVDLDSAHYPERLGYNLVVNCPRIFTFTWKLIRSWLDPVQVAKIRIMGDEKEYGPVLEEIIGSKELAVEFGGSNAVRNHDHNTTLVGPDYKTPPMSPYTSPPPGYTGLDREVDPEVLQAVEGHVDSPNRPVPSASQVHQF